ncbi:hypothetical protein CKO44_18815 [Rubrivivax gelatinosus]|uniref:DUF3325 domain-containing protein n=1 Tax=Rubrivivax gelatinosus TaxID=28068 RepID=UPI001907F11E|nr:DUF3325 domain-containing protein [Rubrivivax gelatinosus]MBK1615517.1 hypothetical protein [Rubrivivax gelatinosus]
MSEPALMLAAASLCALAGFAWLALAMEVHWQQVHGGGTGPRRRLRLLGAGGLVASLLLCLQADPPSMAALVWLMLLAGAVLAVALLLAWQPALLRLAWPRRG